MDACANAVIPKSEATRNLSDAKSEIRRLRLDRAQAHVKHASPTALHRLIMLIEQLRSVPGLMERKPGTFYYRSNAFLHFHEDPAGLFADVKFDFKTFERHRVNTRAEQAALFRSVTAAIAADTRPKPR